MSITVRLPTPLRSAVGGERTIEFASTDLASLQREIADRYPELGARVLRLPANTRSRSWRTRTRQASPTRF